MKVPSHKRNTPPQPSRSLNRQLNLYALAAGAAGASIFAMRQPAQAEVVYTPAHLTLTNGQLLIDLNHDGDVDFIVSDKSGGSCCSLKRKLRVTGAFVGSSQNSVEGVGLNASALKAGAVIGPRDQFLAAPMQMATALNEVTNSFYYVYGPFANTRNRFLGLRFVLHGENHYGWAAFSIVKAGFKGENPIISATLSGYAYETVPDHPLIAGVIKSSSDAMATPSGVETATALQPATLGLLALGYPGLSAWRREESLLTAQ